MQQMPTETYLARSVTELGLWEVGGVRLKVYGLGLNGSAPNRAVVETAQDFTENMLPDRVAAQGGSNGLGFVIIHTGTAGVTVSVRWWVQGSVLCQILHRTLYGSTEPAYPDNAPVIGCVYELGLVDAERRIWQDTMMGTTADPDRYLSTWAGLPRV